MEICYVDGGELGIGMYWTITGMCGGRWAGQANGMEDLTFTSPAVESGMDLDVDKVWNEDQGQGQGRGGGNYGCYGCTRGARCGQSEQRAASSSGASVQRYSGAAAPWHRHGRVRLSAGQSHRPRPGC